MYYYSEYLNLTIVLVNIKIHNCDHSILKFKNKRYIFKNSQTSSSSKSFPALTKALKC